MRRIDELTPIVPGAPPDRPGRVDLWCFFYADAYDEELRRAHHDLLAPDERARLGRLRFERDRALFVATRALVRTALSHYADVAPSRWRFTQDERGKPRVAEAADLPAIGFNLANTYGLAVCAVSLAHARVGVDAERLDGDEDLVTMVDRCLSPREARALRSLPPSAQRERFYCYWTLKESYVKARGLGLAVPLDRFSIYVEDPDEIRIDFDAGIDDDSARWRFAALSASPVHAAAVGADTSGAALDLRAANYVPLRAAIPFPSGPRPRVSLR